MCVCIINGIYNKYNKYYIINGNILFCPAAHITFHLNPLYLFSIHSLPYHLLPSPPPPHPFLCLMKCSFGLILKLSDEGARVFLMRVSCLKPRLSRTRFHNGIPGNNKK